VSVAAHPGYAATDLQRAGPEMDGGPTLQSRAMTLLNQVVAQSASAGAWPQLLAATLPGLAPGAYVGPDGIGEVRGRPTLVGTSAAARDRDARDALWAAAEKATAIPSGPCQLPGRPRCRANSCGVGSGVIRCIRRAVKSGGGGTTWRRAVWSGKARSWSSAWAQRGQPARCDETARRSPSGNSSSR